MQVEAEGPVATRAVEVARLWLFRQLPAVELLELARAAERREYQRPQTLEHRANESGSVYGLVLGDARVVRSTRPNTTVTIAEMHAGDIWGMSMLIKGMAKVSCIEFLSTFAVVYVFPQETVRGVLDRHIELAYRLNEYLFTCLEQARDRIEEMATLTVEGRVAQYLAEKASRHPYGLVLDTQVEMAQVVGASRETVNRAIKRLIASGCVRHAKTGRGLIVPNPSRLVRVS